MKKRLSKSLFLVLLSALIISGCSVLQTISNISRLKYKIGSATNYQIAGIEVKNKRSIKDFNAMEVLKLSGGLMKGSLPLTFILNVEAKNPNNGSGGYPATDISITNFPWRLFVNDKEVVSGGLANPILVPGKGEATIIPLQVQFDLAKSFKEKSLDDLLGLILQVAGAGGSTSNLKLKAQPSLGTPIGNIKYPDEITIVDKTFN
ncbi:MAG: LEA type 2 family protein [Ignavibacteriales bacterium]|nr:LEA type 2 family protein [Ignavibacteriales bacterium]